MKKCVNCGEITRTRMIKFTISAETSEGSGRMAEARKLEADSCDKCFLEFIKEFDEFPGEFEITKPQNQEGSMNRNRRGFTLVELLMTIVIIGILAGLVTSAVMKAVVRAKDGATLTEIQSLDIGLLAFKNNFGQFPPSRIVFAEDGDFSAKNLKEKAPLAPRSLAILRQFWPRIQLRTDETKPLIQGGWYDWNGNHQLDPPYVIDGFTSLVAFLGGVPTRGENGSIGMTGFGSNPNNPFTSPDPPSGGKMWPFSDSRAKLSFFEFRGSRLKDDERNGIPFYNDIYGNPYVYFSAYAGSGYDPDDANVEEWDDQAETKGIRGAFQAGGSITGNRLNPDRKDVVWSLGPNPYTEEQSYPSDVKDLRQRMYYLKNKYQIISAGNDGLWGIGGEWNSKEKITVPIDPVSLKLWTGQSLGNGARVSEQDNLAPFLSH